ncbi:MAG: 2,4-dihydroxyhept-2-ene-1,7-dioic acid aldolase [Verrucomicrobia bacterium]|nr:2,4-dihydroxyhept-2-ene-1,7-dioic acid aldolase [Verrucomicrobiota bacterium]
MSDHFRQRLKGGETLLGTMVTLPTAATAEILADIGFDWLFLDAEHGTLEYSDIQGILQAVGDRVACVVRLPAAAEVPVKKVLDLGAAGIIAPQVNTVEHARDIVRFARYAPEGSRGVGLGRAHGYGMRFAEYMETANDSVAVLVQAEHFDAVECIESIVEIEGLDGIMLGPYDLSASMGKMGQVNDPEVTGAIDRIHQACQSAGIAIGYFGVTAEAVRPYQQKGYNLILAGVDTLHLGNTARNLLSELRSNA